MTPRWVGSILRKHLGLTPRKSHGTYVLPLSEYPKLDELFSRYGLGRVEVGDFGDEGDRGATNGPTQAAA